MKINHKNTVVFAIAFLFGCYLCIAQETPNTEETKTSVEVSEKIKKSKKETSKESTPTEDTTNREVREEKGDLKIVSEKTKKKKIKKPKKAKKIRPYEPLAPARAAFYSAVLPGLGQAYTGNYWKIPLVYAAIGGGIYYFNFNNRIYNEARDIYKRRLAGFTDDRFNGIVSDDSLLSRQRRFRQDREMAILLTTLAYILNIVDANVSAHLQQYNINNDLSVRPDMQFDQLSAQPSFGLKLHYNF